MRSLARQGRRAWRRALRHTASSCIALSAVLGAVDAASAESLKQVLAAAYKYNPRLDAQRAALRATDEEVSKAESGYRPSINAEADVSAESQYTRPPGVRNTTHPKNVGVTAVQPVFSGFQTEYAVKGAEATVRAGRENLREVERLVLLQAVTAFSDVVRDQAIVKLNENNVNVLSRELKATQDRFSVGEVTRTDVAQAEARRAGAVAALDLSRANLKTSRASFEQVVGHAPSQLSEVPVPESALPKSLQSAIATSSQENPLVVGALYQEEASRHQVDQLRGALLPQFRVEASYTDSFEPSPSIDEVRTAKLTGRLTVPILDQGGRVHAEVRQAKHSHVSAIQRVEQARTEVQQAVVAAWSQMEAARARVQSDQAQVQANQTALNGVREEEKVGQRTILDVLNAEQELLNSQVTLATDKRNLLVAAYTLLSHMGRLDAAHMSLAGEIYDPEVHYHEIKRKWWGISITHGDGRREHLDLWETHGRRAPSK